ncbi:hypothetical protein JAAARDRAFT_192592 [Jaapia argillacea MUCL 33604]|uniref:Amine oxidase domain-containing protein n=1 Tax=Jaapia argillacea MUCL 33604 TaxID=933084 RepID=A0A067PW35_9AGAM|nr:hypothetical protein JAAARDRAFT_192592 [Jaapia argillacea MUCL 33604]
MSIRDQYAQHIIKLHHAKLREGNRTLPTVRHREREVNAVVKVGIIGAGVAGLYSAMMLDYLSQYGFDYQIIEASSRRVGGRLYTYNFPGGGANDYYDIGAMRFPQIPFMSPTFNLIQNILGLKMIPYYLSQPFNLNFFNGIVLTNEALSNAYAAGNPDPFNTGVDLPGGPDVMADNALGTFKQQLKDDWEKGWDALMAVDQYSTREYMSSAPNGPGYTQRVINQLELFESATGLYDRAFSESVMDSLDFDYADPSPPWFCLQGGVQQIATTMEATLDKTKFIMGQRVTAIEPINSSPSGPATSVNLITTTPIGTTTYTYDHVISTLPFGCLRMVDTSKCGFSWDLQTAIRALRYDDAAKFAIKFTTRWWELPAYGSQKGGVSSTDRPTRTVVYPSYGIGGNDGASIIVSYTWSQDALRFGSFIDRQQTVHLPDEARLLDVILKDLADMHGITDYTYLPKLVDKYHAYHWYSEPNAAGAFALFGPSQFSGIYTEVTQPSGGVIHWAGEATSVHHAWVVGALNSAYRAVTEILTHEGKTDLIPILQKKFPGIDELPFDLIEQQVALGQRRKMTMGRNIRDL